MICSFLSMIVVVVSALVFIPFFLLKTVVVFLIILLAGLVGCNLPQSFPYRINLSKKDRDKEGN